MAKRPKAQKSRRTQSPKSVPLRRVHGIVPRSGLYLYAFEGNGPRFASIFRDAWKRIPLWSRRRLLHYWRSMKPKIKGGHKAQGRLHWPHIEMCRATSDSRRGMSRAAIAQCKFLGCKFWFLAAVVDAMPENIAQVLVAHELGHSFILTHQPEHASDYLAEYEVRELLFHSWGFDEELLDKWKSDNVELLRRVSTF